MLKGCLFCLMRQKHSYNYFAFNHIWLKKNSFSGAYASWDKIKIYYFTWVDQDWIGLMIFKNFVDQYWIKFNFIRTGL